MTRTLSLLLAIFLAFSFIETPSIDADAATPGTIISRGKTANMINSKGETINPINGSYIIDYLTDGNYETQAGTTWQQPVAGKYDVIFEIDLEGWYDISEVLLVQRGNICYPIDFTIDVWDGATWNSVKSVVGNKPSDPEIDVTDKEVSTPWSTLIAIESDVKTGSKIRLHATNLAGHGNVQHLKGLFLYEMEIYGTPSEAPIVNISRYKTAKMLKSDGTLIPHLNDYIISRLTDGIYDSTLFAATIWQNTTPGNDDVIFEIDLNGWYEVTGVTLTNVGNKCYPIDFTIDIWDGTKWNTVKSVIGNMPTDPEIIEAPGDVRTPWKTELTMTGNDVYLGTKVRIHATNLAQHANVPLRALFLHEMDVFGKASVSQSLFGDIKYKGNGNIVTPVYSGSSIRSKLVPHSDNEMIMCQGLRFCTLKSSLPERGSVINYLDKDFTVLNYGTIICANNRYDENTMTVENANSGNYQGMALLSDMINWTKDGVEYVTSYVYNIGHMYAGTPITARLYVSIYNIDNGIINLYLDTQTDSVYDQFNRATNNGENVTDIDPDVLSWIEDYKATLG